MTNKGLIFMIVLIVFAAAAVVVTTPPPPEPPDACGDRAAHAQRLCQMDTSQPCAEVFDQHLKICRDAHEHQR